METLGENVSVIDYKFHCINGHVYGEYVCYDRVPGTHKVNYDHYDADLSGYINNNGEIFMDQDIATMFEGKMAIVDGFLGKSIDVIMDSKKV